MLPPSPPVSLTHTPFRQQAPSTQPLSSLQGFGQYEWTPSQANGWQQRIGSRSFSAIVQMPLMTPASLYVSTLHVSQHPVQAVLQQTLSTQKPLEHSHELSQSAPFFFFSPQVPQTQPLPAPQSESCLQVQYEGDDFP